MLGNVLGLFPGMGSDAVHGSICICHLLLRCPIACLRLFYAAHLVLVLLVLVASAGKIGGDLRAPYCIAARVAAALVIQSSGGAFYCAPSCMIAQVDTALTMHSLGLFPSPRPRPAPSLCGGLKMGPLGLGGGGGQLKNLIATPCNDTFCIDHSIFTVFTNFACHPPTLCSARLNAHNCNTHGPRCTQRHICDWY